MRSSQITIGPLLLFLFGCGREQTPPADPFGPYEWAVVWRGHSSTAPRYTPPRGHFEFVVDTGYERFDSKSGDVLRHPPGEPDARTSITLSSAERDTLWELLVRSGFLEARPMVGYGMNGSPDSGPIDIEVLADSVRHAVRWNPTIPELVPQMAPRHPRPVDPEEPGMAQFVNRLRDMLERRASYRALPRGMPTL